MRATGYPACSYTRNLTDHAAPDEPEVVEGRTCLKYQAPLVIKTVPYGKFIGCSAYPKCRHIEPLEKPSDSGIECPQCKKGNILKRKSHSGKIFYSCLEYPKCDYALWNTPVKVSCPDCHWPILTVKETKRRDAEKVCPQKDYKYATP